MDEEPLISYAWNHSTKKWTVYYTSPYNKVTKKNEFKDKIAAGIWATNEFEKDKRKHGK